MWRLIGLILLIYTVLIVFPVASRVLQPINKTHVAPLRRKIGPVGTNSGWERLITLLKQLLEKSLRRASLTHETRFTILNQ